MKRGPALPRQNPQKDFNQDAKLLPSLPYFPQWGRTSSLREHLEAWFLSDLLLPSHLDKSPGRVALSLLVEANLEVAIYLALSCISISFRVFSLQILDYLSPRTSIKIACIILL